MLDFSPVRNKEKKYIDLAEDNSLTVQDLRDLTNESVDYLLSLLDDLTDEDVSFEPDDPDADDPYAVEGEEEIGWTFGHLIAHVTASSEEGAAFSSFLARGVPDVKDRPRVETPWREMDSVDKCTQRLEESRRMRLAYLDTWPDNPVLDNYRVLSSDRAREYWGNLNAYAAFLMGLGHEVGHYDQIKESRDQALAARQTQA